jgi:alpha/beta superfamily hydrolase
MLEKFKANIVFNLLLKRRDINKAYKMVGPEDSWYDTITTVHNSLAEIRKLPFENWELTSFDGLRLKAIYYPGNSDKTVIWVHGYTSHAERESAFPGLFYHSLGYNVLIPYLRTHGPSEGKWITMGTLEARDIMGWVNKVNAIHPEGSVLIHGLSMGGGIVLDLATKDMANVKCLVADAPVDSLPQSFQRIIGGTFKKNQEKIVAHLKGKYNKVFSVNVDDYDFVENLKQGKYPLLLSAGSNENLDEILHKMKQNNPQDTTVLILPGCNHGNGMYKQTELYQGAIREFVEKYM